MKTVSGAVVSSKPVSLSKAAKILSKFALADNGAPPAFVAYLGRASDSFDELVQLHKELRGSGSEHKSKKHRSGNHDGEEPSDSVVDYGEGQGRKNGVGTRKKYVKEKKAGADGKKGAIVSVYRLDEGKYPKKKKNVMDKTEEKGNGVVKVEEQSIRAISNLETVDNSVESKKRKKELKKIKRDASEEGISNGVVDIEKEPSHGGHGIANEEQVENYVKNEGFERKKNQKMNKEYEVEMREKKTADLRNQRYVGDGDFDGVGNDNAGAKKRSKRKKIHEGEMRDGENEKKGSKKRKSEEIADGEVTDSAEKRMLKKKKKGKSEVDN